MMLASTGAESKKVQVMIQGGGHDGGSQCY